MTKLPTPSEAEDSAIENLPSSEVFKLISEKLNYGEREIDFNSIFSKVSRDFPFSQLRSDLRKKAMIELVESEGKKSGWIVEQEERIVVRGDFRGESWKEETTILKFSPDQKNNSQAYFGLDSNQIEALENGE